MNPSISSHALKRFIERRDHSRGCPLVELKELLQRAEPEELGVAGVRRLMRNNFEKAKYYIFNGWRFVLSEDETRLITCERRILKPYKPKKDLKPKRRGVWT